MQCFVKMDYSKGVEIHDLYEMDRAFKFTGLLFSNLLISLIFLALLRFNEHIMLHCFYL